MTDVYGGRGYAGPDLIILSKCTVIFILVNLPQRQESISVQVEEHNSETGTQLSKLLLA